MNPSSPKKAGIRSGGDEQTALPLAFFSRDTCTVRFTRCTRARRFSNFQTHTHTADIHPRTRQVARAHVRTCERTPGTNHQRGPANGAARIPTAHTQTRQRVCSRGEMSTETRSRERQMLSRSRRTLHDYAQTEPSRPLGQYRLTSDGSLGSRRRASPPLGARRWRRGGGERSAYRGNVNRSCCTEIIIEKIYRSKISCLCKMKYL